MQQRKLNDLFANFHFFCAFDTLHGYGAGQLQLLLHLPTLETVNLSYNTSDIGVHQQNFALFYSLVFTGYA